MENVNTYYLVSQEDYETKFQNKPQLNDKLKELAPRLEKKVRKLLDFLLINGIGFNEYGIINTQIQEIPTKFSILEFSIYAILAVGKEPLGFEQFLKFLIRINAPLDLFCKRIQRQIIKLEKHVKPKRVKTEEKEEQIVFA